MPSNRGEDSSFLSSLTFLLVPSNSRARFYLVLYVLLWPRLTAVRNALSETPDCDSAELHRAPSLQRVSGVPGGVEHVRSTALRPSFLLREYSSR